MTENEIVDSEFNEIADTTISNLPFRKKFIRLMTIIIVILISLNYFLTSLTTNREVLHLDGSVATLTEIKRATLFTLIFGITIIGFLLGALTSFIPYREMKYAKKYLLFSLFNVIVIQLVFLALAVLKYVRLERF